MAPRDPIKTQRTKLIESMKIELRQMLPEVLQEANLRDEFQLNGIIGSKASDFIDLHNAIIQTPEAYVALWMDGFQAERNKPQSDPKYMILYRHLKASEVYRKYLHLFLRRSFLTHFDEYNRPRPDVNDAEVWIGQNRANYGILVAPRFEDGRWENDKSEIRRFKQRYWTIGHIMETGLVVPNADRRMNFLNVEQYLNFFCDVLVRSAGSIYQDRLAELYCQYVLSRSEKYNIPLLIPEFRYNGISNAHKYRIDFTIIHPYTLDKVGFEISPWSTHGKITGTKSKSQNEINKIAAENRFKEIEKEKAFFRKYGITTLIYSDKEIEKIDDIFSEIKFYLERDVKTTTFTYMSFEEYFK